MQTDTFLISLLLLTALMSGTRAASGHDISSARAVVSLAEVMLRDKHASAQTLAQYLGRDIQLKDNGRGGYAYSFQAKSKQFDRSDLDNGPNIGGSGLWLELGMASDVVLRIADLVQVLGPLTVVRRFDYEPEAKWVYRKRGMRRYAVIYARMGGPDDQDQLPPDLTMQTYVITITIKEALSPSKTHPAAK